MPQLTELLKKAIEKEFKAHILRMGFQPEKSHSQFFPFRRSTPVRDELIEVQFDKSNRPRFVLNFGIVPSGGLVDAYGRLLETKDVRIANLMRSGRLYSFPYSIKWFTPNCFFGFRPPAIAVQRTVEDFIRLYGMVENWFMRGIPGPNLRFYTHEWNAPNVRKKSMQQRGVWPPEEWTEEDEKAVKLAESLLSEQDINGGHQNK